MDFATRAVEGPAETSAARRTGSSRADRSQVASFEDMLSAGGQQSPRPAAKDQSSDDRHRRHVDKSTPKPRIETSRAAKSAKLHEEKPEAPEVPQVPEANVPAVSPASDADKANMRVVETDGTPTDTKINDADKAAGTDMEVAAVPVKAALAASQSGTQAENTVAAPASGTAAQAPGATADAKTAGHINAAPAVALAQAGEPVATPEDPSGQAAGATDATRAPVDVALQTTSPSEAQTLVAKLAALGATPTEAGVDDLSVDADAVARAQAGAQASSTSAQVSEGSPDLAGGTANVAQDLAIPAEVKGPGAQRAAEGQTTDSRPLKPGVSTHPAPANNGSPQASPAAQPSPSAGSSAPTSASATAQQVVAGAVGSGNAKSASRAAPQDIAATPTTGPHAHAGADASSGLMSAGDATHPESTATQARPAALPPHTVPTLAAAMMRRIHNGMKEFTLRLDPPELGRVDVRLTVGEDKKVRAVVTTDRPEALVDLALSARELTRALQDAGLEIDDNGLTFSMNDQGNAHEQGQGESQHTKRPGLERSDAAGAEDEAAHVRAQASSQILTNKNMFSGPVERWQRARITLTA